MYFSNFIAYLFAIIATLSLPISCSGSETIENFPYSFSHAPYVSPWVIEQLTPLWPSAERKEVASILLWRPGDYVWKNDQTSFEYNYFEEEPSCSFSYYCVGKSESGIYVLHTSSSGGGTGIFKGLVFVVIEKSTDVVYDEDEKGYSTHEYKESILIKKIGEFYLGDRWFGKIEIKGNTLLIGENEHHHPCYGRDEDDPYWSKTHTIDLKYASPVLLQKSLSTP